MNKLISKYNNPNTLLVIGSFPDYGQNYSPNQDAVAWYLKNRLNAAEKHSNLKTVIFTHTKKGKGIYEDQNSLIIPCIERNSPLSWFRLFKNIFQFNYPQNILIEFEFATFGDTFTTMLFPIFLVLLKLLNKNVTVELHQALLDLNKLHGHIGHQKNDRQIKVMSKVIKLFYASIGLLSDQVIVLEEEFKNRLKEIIKPDKITTIPLGVNSNKPIDKKTARKKLNLPQSDFLVLNFGFLTWYKGSDLSVETSKYISSKNVKIVLAGGSSFTQKNKPHYQRFIKQINESTDKNPKIITTGFVDEKDVALYFSAADLVILPYRTFMSSSGPLSLALSYEKPVLLGTPLKQYMNSKDFNEALLHSGLKSNDLFVSIKPKKLAVAITDLKKTAKLDKLIAFSKELKRSRSFEKQAEVYQHAILKETENVNLIQHPNLSVN